MAVTSYTPVGIATELNSTLKSLGYDYQIDTTSEATITEGFNTIGAFPPNMLDNILNMQIKILQQRSYTSMFSESKNPMRRFWRNAVDYGGGIQDIFVKLIESENGYWAEENPDAEEVAKDLVAYKPTDIISKIHTVTDKFRIKMSISDLEYAKVFTVQGYGEFINSKYATLQQSAERALMNIGIRVAKEMIEKKHVKFVSGLSVNTENGVTGAVEAINTVSDGMQTLTKLYNYDEVETTTEFDNLYLMVTPEFYNRIKSRGYANAFNLEEYRAKNRLIMLPAGTDLGKGENGKSIGCVLLDYRAITLAVRYWEVMPFIVANTDYRNTYLKVQLVTGYTEFFNAVAFETGDVDFFTQSNDTFYLHVPEELALYSDYYKINVNGVSLFDYPFVNPGGATDNADGFYVIPQGALLEFLDNSAAHDPDSASVLYLTLSNTNTPSFNVWDARTFQLPTNVLYATIRAN